MKIQAKKQKIRDQVKTDLKNLSLQKREDISQKLCEKLKNTTLWKTSQHILLYAPLQDEVNVFYLFGDKKIFYFPQVDQNALSIYRVKKLDELTSGSFSLKEPHKKQNKVSQKKFDLIVVPGLAFSLNGKRLGRGKGFYDRFLSSLRHNPNTVSLAFSFQIFDNIPWESHDININHIITLQD